MEQIRINQTIQKDDEQAVAPNKRGRRLLMVAWIGFWVIGFCLAAELAGRQLLAVPLDSGQRPLQPYLMNGDFYEKQSRDLMLEREGPTAYGYSPTDEMLYVYDFNKPVNSISEHFEFLFQDRANLVKDKNQGELRIFVIGGSAAQGTGASTIERRYYVLLEKKLSAELNVPVQVIPSAMGAFISTQERIVQQLAVLPNNPDLIIIFDGFNDAALPAVYGARPGDPYNMGIRYQEFYAPSFLAKKWLLERSHLYRYWFYSSLANALEEYRQDILQSSEKSNLYAQSTAAVYSDNITHMAQACDHFEIPCIFFLQPARALTLRNQGIQPMDSVDILTLAAYDAILHQMESLSSEIRFIPLTSLFDSLGEEKWFFDWVHFNDKGHQEVADTMYPYVLETLRQARVAD